MRKFGENIRYMTKKKDPHCMQCGSFLVDLEGFEPLTSRMRTERSPN